MLVAGGTRFRFAKIALALLLPPVALMLWPGFLDLVSSTTGHDGHGVGLSFDPELVAVHVITNVLTGLSYLIISGGLCYLVYKARRDLPFHNMLLAFGLFIVSCGIGHFIDALTLWTPLYWLSGLVMVITAASSMIVAVQLPGLVPGVFHLISEHKANEQQREQVQSANQALISLNAELVVQIKERERVEDALRLSEERARILLASLPQSIVFKDRNSVFVSVNSVVARDLGLEPEDMVGKTDYDLYSPEMAAAYIEDDRQVMESCEAKTIQEINTASAKQRMVEVVKVPVMGTDSDVIGVLCIFTDITERRQTEQALKDSEERYRTVYNALQEGVVLQNADGTIQSANASAERILGLSLDQMKGRTSIDPMWRSLHEDGTPFPGEEHPIVVSLKTGQAQRSIIIGMQKPDGTLVWVSVNSQPLFKHGEIKPYAAVASFNDITELKLLEQSITLSEERYRSLFTHSMDAILLTVPDGRILAANPAATFMFKQAEADLIRLGRSSVVDANDSRLKRLIEERTRTGTAKGEITMKRGDGSLFPAEITSAIYHDSKGMSQTSMFIRDMTEHKKISEQLVYQAFHDSLTHLPNRAFFMELLDLHVAQVKRDKRRLFAVLFIDLDAFKLINDSLGHAAGDMLLAEFADRLKTCVRANDTVSRLGGDEFTILLDGIDSLEDATTTADRVQALLKHPFYLAGREVFITVSLGIAMSTSDFDSAEQLLRHADTAMYSAKTAGKDHYVVFETYMRTGGLETLHLDADLHGPVQNGGSSL